jgi:plasmid segregation protein ParM
MTHLFVGLDIGYSNLKLACQGAGDSSPRDFILPAGAAPLADLPHKLGGGVDDQGVMIVDVDGERWAAGVDQSRLEGARQLHHDYPSTKPYKALFQAALLMSEADQVEHLVTGLPVTQAFDPGCCEALARRLQGEHRVAKERSVLVRRVTVLAQPIGAYCRFLDTTDQPTSVAASKVLVVDPGCYSFDYSVVEDGGLRPAASGSSPRAMSAVLEAANGLIRDEHGGAPGLPKLENALRQGNASVMLYGRFVEITKYVEAAAAKVAGEALTELKNAQRMSDRPFDIVLLTGGGAALWQAPTQAAFPKSRVVMLENSPAANAQGFLAYAVQS